LELEGIMRRRDWIVLAALTAASPGRLFGQSQEVWFGTWVLNLEKSAYAKGAPRPQRTTTRVEPWGDGLKYTSDSVNGRGVAGHTEWRAKFDGKDYPVTGVPTVDSYALRRVDAHTYEVIAKKNGMVTTVSRSVISADGKTRTVTQLGQHAEGDTVNNTLVFDRQ
jgi:hypothetical protein